MPRSPKGTVLRARHPLHRLGSPFGNEEVLDPFQAPGWASSESKIPGQRRKKRNTNRPTGPVLPAAKSTDQGFLEPPRPRRPRSSSSRRFAISRWTSASPRPCQSGMAPLPSPATQLTVNVLCLSPGASARRRATGRFCATRLAANVSALTVEVAKGLSQNLEHCIDHLRQLWAPTSSQWRTLLVDNVGSDHLNE